MRVYLNKDATRSPYLENERAVTSIADAKAARLEISKWEGYAPSPVHMLKGSAAELGLDSVMMKDESGRLGQNSFKSLGGAFAATLMVQDLDDPQSAVLCTATEGNHGRSVAFAAKRLGCRAVIFMQENALEHKVAAIEALGAQVIYSPGNYDDSVLVAAEQAQRNGWLLISDTNSAEDRTVHHVMHGYGVMALELEEQLTPAEFPTHIFLQAGVGGLAAGVIGVLSDLLGAARPYFIIVEPENAACVFASAVQQAPAQIGGDIGTVMQMLAVGNASPAAWPVLARRADAFITIDDEDAILTRGRLLRSELSSDPHDIGLSGVAGLSGLHRLVRDKPELAVRMGLDHKARVMVFGTEAGPSQKENRRNAETVEANVV